METKRQKQRHHDKLAILAGCIILAGVFFCSAIKNEVTWAAWLTGFLGAVWIFEFIIEIVKFNKK